jgi:hypothetical protein
MEIFLLASHAKKRYTHYTHYTFLDEKQNPKSQRSWGFSV